MKLLMTDIGNRIKERRKELGLSQTEIDEKCGISSGALSKIENGKTTPSIIAFYKLSQVLNCDINWLATGFSSNFQNNTLCKLEDELLKNFRILPDDEQKEILEFITFKIYKLKRDKNNIAKSYDLKTIESVDVV